MAEPVPSDTASPRPRLGEFPPSITIPPTSTHKITIIFLHGRGWDAKKFSASLLPAPASPTTTFHSALPHARFVFPTAPLMRATKYRRAAIHQWYEGTGDWEPGSRGQMRPSIEHIHGILRDEIQMLGGDSRRVVLAGLSQGCAMALMCLLLWNGKPLGAMVGMCGFMPLTASLMTIFQEGEQNDNGIIFGEEDDGEPSVEKTPLQRAIEELCEEAEIEPLISTTLHPFLSTPVFMGHGLQDKEVDISHGQGASTLLKTMGASVSFHTYSDLGHWYNSEMLHEVVLFLQKTFNT